MSGEGILSDLAFADSLLEVIKGIGGRGLFLYLVKFHDDNTIKDILFIKMITFIKIFVF